MTAVSTARADITPAGYALMGGYGTTAGPRSATGTHAPLTARAVALWDTPCTPRVLLSADLLGIPAPVDALVRAALPDLGASDLLLLASHTHNGPVLPVALDPWIAYGIADLPPVDAYGQTLAGQLVALIQAALTAPRTAVTLDYQVTSQAWSANRAGLPYAETAVPVLVARGADGAPLVVLHSYGCHPVASGQQTRWDPDYPGVASAVIEAALPGAMAVYLPGPAGDQDPVGARGWGLASRLGAQLGAVVVSAAVTPGRPLTGAIDTAHTTAALPLDITPTAANLAAVRAIYVSRSTDAGRSAWYRRHGQPMVDRIDSGVIATTVPAPVTRWRIGGTQPLQIAMVGGELVSGYGVWARGQYGGTAGLVIGGYAGGCACYVPSNALLPPLKTGGSYEGGWDTDAPGVAGGSQTVYGHLGHFRGGSAGVEATMLAALTSVLA